VYGFTYDILIYPQHLSVTLDLIQGGNEQKFILDHLAKPNIKNGTSATWATDLKKLAFHKNVFCKLSGMVTEADHRTWTKEDIYPYMDKVLEFFGPERLLFGSDWPVCRLAASYNQVCDLMNDYLKRLTIHEQELIWGKNATLFYKL
jgi:L-fuconolactonase